VRGYEIKKKMLEDVLSGKKDELIEEDEGLY
jgi:hypothetical protein